MSDSPSPPLLEGGGGGVELEGGDGGEQDIVGAPVDLGARRVSDPSSSRPRLAETVWPEHFVEAVAARVAIDAARTDGRLAAAPAIATVFQVCSTWRSVSRSELLWEEVTRGVWSNCSLHVPLPPSTWRDEFVRLHRTARNFRTRRSTHSYLNGDIPCRRLALSDRHLAAGFIDGTVRVFELPSSRLVATYGPHPQRAHLGRFSESISGLLFPSPEHLVFASQDGDVHVAPLSDPAARRAHIGNPVDDGPLIDFSGDARWWVGLFAGVPGRSWHVWDGESEQLVYVGGSLTDPDAVSGWRMLAELGTPAVGRVRIPEPGLAVGCTRSRIQVLDLDDDIGSIVGDFESRRGVNVDMMDACDGRVMVVDQRRMARVRVARTFEEVCRFSTEWRGDIQPQQLQWNIGVGSISSGCMNWGYAVVCSDGEIRVWDVVTGEFLYRFAEIIGFASVVTANDRYVSAWSEDTGLHLWDFQPV